MKAAALLCLLHAMSLQASGQYVWDGIPTPASRQIRTTTQNFDWHGSAGTSAASSACSVDPHSCACCAMVQEVNMTAAHFNTVLTELETEYGDVERRFHIASSRRVAFSASLKKEDGLSCEEPNSVDDVIKYQHVFLNLGGAYNQTTGVFTAPYAGLYAVTASVYSDSGSSAITLNACASLQVNGLTMASARDRNKYDHEDSATIFVALHLKAGDEVVVRSAVGCLLCDDGRYNTFSVFLLHATV